ncbi:hypothetical protein BRD00_14645 [Halobacteriales archaeon QS_8_69_26]|nr:MAG: hypothetical protein BRD00_14645 [Halobacteriales archaeon QS_8_69_26]
MTGTDPDSGEVDPAALDRRLRAVERALTDGEGDAADLPDLAALADRVSTLEDRVDPVEDRLEEQKAAIQAVRGYVGNVRAVNRDVEERADAALAAVQSVEYRLDGHDAPRRPVGHDDGVDGRIDSPPVDADEGEWYDAGDGTLTKVYDRRGTDDDTTGDRGEGSGIHPSDGDGNRDDARVDPGDGNHDDARVDPGDGNRDDARIDPGDGNRDDARIDQGGRNRDDAGRSEPRTDSVPRTEPVESGGDTDAAGNSTGDARGGDDSGVDWQDVVSPPADDAGGRSGTRESGGPDSPDGAGGGSPASDGAGSGSPVPDRAGWDSPVHDGTGEGSAGSQGTEPGDAGDSAPSSDSPTAGDPSTAGAADPVDVDRSEWPTFGDGTDVGGRSSGQSGSDRAGDPGTAGDRAEGAGTGGDRAEGAGTGRGHEANTGTASGHEREAGTASPRGGEGGSGGVSRGSVRSGRTPSDRPGRSDSDRTGRADGGRTDRTDRTDAGAGRRSPGRGGPGGSTRSRGDDDPCGVDGEWTWPPDGRRDVERATPWGAPDPVPPADADREDHDDEGLLARLRSAL